MISRLRGEGVHQLSDGRGQRRGCGAAVETQVERDLVVARSAGVEPGASGSDLGQSPLHRGVDVLVGLDKVERARLEL